MRKTRNKIKIERKVMKWFSSGRRQEYWAGTLNIEFFGIQYFADIKERYIWKMKRSKIGKRFL